MMKQRGKQRPLGRKLLVGLALFGFLIMVMATYIVAPLDYRAEMSEYSRLAFCYTRTAAEFIDGDRVLDYLKPIDGDSRKGYYTDDYYDDVMKFLASTQKECKLMSSYYVGVPYEDHFTYVWDAYTEDQPCPRGYSEEYDSDAKKLVVAYCFKKDPEEKITIIHDETWGDIACAYSPIFNSDGEPVALAGVDIPIQDIINATIINILITDSIILALTLIAITLGYGFIKRRVVQPIGILNAASKEMVEDIDHDRFSDLNIHTHDELEELANSFGKMRSDLCDYIARLSSVTAEKERISTELNIATQIQADMLPRDFPAFPERKEFDLYASMDPAKEVGGDFYDFFLIDDNHLALVMADVSGKGVPAALFMANAKSLIKNRAQIGGGPAEILDYVNEKLCEGNKLQYFVTVWLAIIDLSTGKGVAANAGHEHPALRRADGDFELVIYPHSPGVAMFDEILFTEHSFELYPGDALFVYTDSVPEAADNENVLFDTDRMLKALNKDPGAEPETLVRTVRSEIDRFVGDAPQFDDITMLALRYNGAAKSAEELTVDAVSENFDRVLDFVDSFLNGFDCPQENKNQVRIAVEELFVNIASYAYSPETGTVTVRVKTETSPPSVTVTFIDEGVPFNPLNRQDPDITLHPLERQIGGMGIFTVKTMMDETEYEYRDGKNMMTIKKIMK